MKCPECEGEDAVRDGITMGIWCPACGGTVRKELYKKPAVGAKDTAGKPRYSLLPRKGCLAVIEARQYGAQKYGSDENWVKVSEVDWINAALRHIYAHLDGEDKDPESGVRHLHHASCSLFLACSIKEEPTA